MVRIVKGKVKPHILIPDTSILWHEDKQFVAHPDFDSFWDSYAEKYDLQLLVPEVVKGELSFQQTTSGLRSLKKANQSFADLERVIQRKCRHRISEPAVRNDIERRFRKWLERKKGTVLSTPVSSVDWKALIEKAIWRSPPFEFDPKNPDNEKGFRDSLILETVRSYCREEKNDVQIAFLCKDQLLRETTETELKEDKRFAAFQELADFKSYLDLTREKLEDKFIRAILQRATEKFFSKGDLECLYYKDDIRSKLQEKYKKYFENPEESEEKKEGFLSSVLGLSSPRVRWESNEPGTFWISRAQFHSTETANIYVWKNSVTYARPFNKYEIVAIPIQPAVPLERRLLLLQFSIEWKARVSSDGRFWEYSLVSDSLERNSFKAITEEDAKIYLKSS